MTTKAQLQAQLDEALRRIEAGHAMVRQLRAEIQQLKTQHTLHRDEPVVTRFMRGGRLYEKTRIGKYATEHVVEFHVVAGKYDGDEENCKFADTRMTREEAEALLDAVADYPWSRIEERVVK